jgi:hypothetical protein
VLIASAPTRPVRNIGAWMLRWLQRMNLMTLRRHPAAELHGC